MVIGLFDGIRNSLGEAGMTASVRALLTRSLDDAALFPPAELPIDQAIRNYAGHRQGTEGWMLGSFVIGAGKLPELEALLRDLKEPVCLSLLGGGGGSMGEVL